MRLKYPSLSHLQAKLLRAQQGRKQKLHASSELLGSLRASRQLRARAGRDQDSAHQLGESLVGSDDDPGRSDVAEVEHEMVAQLRAQQQELQSVRCALEAAHAKRALEAEDSARVTTAWNQAVMQVGRGGGCVHHPLLLSFIMCHQSIRCWRYENVQAAWEKAQQPEKESGKLQVQQWMVW